MKTFLRGITVVSTVVAVAVFSLPGSPARPDPPELTTTRDSRCGGLRDRERSQPLHSGRAANSRLTANPPKPIPAVAIRANSLMIALVAQNRLGAAASDTGRLTSLRETALKLTREVERQPNNLTEIDRLAARLDQFPEIPPDRGASRAPVRLLDTFNHDDVVGLFASCGTNRSQEIEKRLISLARKTPIMPEQECEIELLAFKVALISDLVREMDHFVPASRAKERPEWVRLAPTFNGRDGRLAEIARGRDPVEIRRAVARLTPPATTAT